MKRVGPDTLEGTLTDVAYRHLRRDIIDGTRPPGERLRIERLKTLYEIGPTPLREALQKLAQDGLVVGEGHRGFAVAPLDPAEFADLNIARTVVEKEALALSIRHGDDAWEGRVVAAAHLMAKEDTRLISTTDHLPDIWERANTEFHAALVSACTSTWLLRIRAGLHDLVERYRRASVSLHRGERDLPAEHARIVEAALARDTDRAVGLIEAHFALTASMLAAERAGDTAAE